MSKRKTITLELIILTFAIGLLMNGSWIHIKANLAYSLIDNAWHKSQLQQSPQKPWPWADTWPVAKLSFAGSDNLLVMSGTHGEALAFGPGYDTSSSLPGEAGPVIIAGHRDTHFKQIKHLENGDIISLEDQHKEMHQYQVSELTVVDSRVSKQITASDDEHLILITCYPFFTLNTGGPLRYVVVANKLLPPKKEIIHHSL